MAIKKNGVVVKDAMNKTIAVKVDNYQKHSLYGKRVLKSKKFYAHDEKNVSKAGDSVTIIECRPLSKTKRWMLITNKAEI